MNFTFNPCIDLAAVFCFHHFHINPIENKNEFCFYRVQIIPIGNKNTVGIITLRIVVHERCCQFYGVVLSHTSKL